MLAGPPTALSGALALLLVVAGVDLVASGATGHCRLYQKLGYFPSSLRRAWWPTSPRIDWHGRRSTANEWETGPTNILALFPIGAQFAACAHCGEDIDDDLMLAFNTVIQPVDLTFSAATCAPAWQLALTTPAGELPDRGAALAVLPAPSASVTLLMHGRWT